MSYVEFTERFLERAKRVRARVEVGDYWFFVFRGTKHLCNYPAKNKELALKEAANFLGRDPADLQVSKIGNLGVWDGSKCVSKVEEPRKAPRARLIELDEKRPRARLRIIE